MPRGGFSGSLRSPKIDVLIDTGNPFLNRTVDGFLKIGAVGACKVVAEETFECLHRARGACVRAASLPLLPFFPPSSSSLFVFSISVLLHSTAQEPLFRWEKFRFCRTHVRD